MCGKWTIVCLVLILGCLAWRVNSVAVMSVDLGSEWMKIGIVSPGVPMEIVLNKESKRKTPAIVAYRDNMRTFGEDAQTIGIRFPKNSYAYLLDLLGKDIDNPVVKLFQKRFPHYELVADPERRTVLFKHENDVLYSPEELIGQLLHRAKEWAEQSALQPVNEMVLTVPGFFNQAERRALLQAAELAGLKVLQLINDYTAIAMNYGIFRRKDFNDTAQYVMFYDMGASKTTATIVGYQNVKTKDRGYVETNPILTILGVGYDRTLGGLEIQLRLRDHLATKFNELKKTKTDVFTNPRSMAKLFKEAGRLKNVLSANAEFVAQVEGLIEEIDFRQHVTREQLEALIPDLLERVGGPVNQALATAGLTMDVIGQVILVGAGTRVPKIQETLQAIVGMELSKNINTDEAAAMGAVYKGADLSTGFKVKKFLTKDAVVFPVQVMFQRDGKQVKRMLFSLMNPYPQKKIITFNKHTDDFTFNVNYAELNHLGSDEEQRLGSLNLSKVAVTGVKAALNKYSPDVAESKGIKAHFSMDESGVLTLVNIEAIFEKSVSDIKEEESPLSKLGSTISKLFTSGGDTPTPSPAENATETPEDNSAENKTETNTTQPTNTTKTDTKPKIVTVKEPVGSEESILNIKQMSPEQFQKSVRKLTQLHQQDMDRERRENALNALESLVIEARTRLDTKEYSEASTPEETAKIMEECTRISDWLYEDGADADAETYEKKISEMQKLTDSLYARVWEHHERPEALKVLRQRLNDSNLFIESAKNLTKSVNPDKDVFTDVEIETLKKAVTETVEWRDKLVLEQSKLKKSDPVTLTVKMISEKITALDREVKYLINKLKIWRPKVSEKEKAKEKVKETKPEGDKTKESQTTGAETQEVPSDTVIDPTTTEDNDQHSEL